VKKDMVPKCPVYDQNNHFALVSDCLLYSQPMAVDFWFDFIGVYGHTSVDLGYVYWGFIDVGDAYITNSQTLFPWMWFWR
jgi:hypothetical protein